MTNTRVPNIEGRFRAYAEKLSTALGLIITPRLTAATRTAERDTAERLVGDLRNRHHITVRGDKAYDTREFVQALRVLNVVPHAAQNCNGRNSAIDGRTTRHPGYAISQRLRKRVEEVFGSQLASGRRGVGKPKIWRKLTFSPNLCYFGTCEKNWLRKRTVWEISLSDRGPKTIFWQRWPRLSHNLR